MDPITVGYLILLMGLLISSCPGMSILRQGWTNGNYKERTLYDINERRSNLPFVQDWPKAAFLDRN